MPKDPKEYLHIINQAFQGRRDSLNKLENVPANTIQRVKKILTDSENCRRRDLLANKKPEKITYNKGKEKKKTKAHHAYSLEEYLKTYDPIQMFEIAERMDIRGIIIKSYGTSEHKSIGQQVKVRLTFHILEGKVGEVIREFHGKLLVSVPYKRHVLECWFDKEELE